MGCLWGPGWSQGPAPWDFALNNQATVAYEAAAWREGTGTEPEGPLGRAGHSSWWTAQASGTAPGL